MENYSTALERERLQIVKTAKFESDSLKTNEGIAPQTSKTIAEGRITFKFGGFTHFKENDRLSQTGECQKFRKNRGMVSYFQTV